MKLLKIAILSLAFAQNVFAEIRESQEKIFYSHDFNAIVKETVTSVSPDGSKFDVEWLNTKTGSLIKRYTLDVKIVEGMRSFTEKQLQDCNPQGVSNEVGLLASSVFESSKETTNTEFGPIEVCHYSFITYGLGDSLNILGGEAHIAKKIGLIRLTQNKFYPIWGTGKLQKSSVPAGLPRNL